MDKIYRDPKTNNWTIEVENSTGPNIRHSIAGAKVLSLEEVKPFLIEWKRNFLETRGK